MNFIKKKKIHIKTNLVEEFLVADTSEHVVKKLMQIIYLIEF